MPLVEQQIEFRRSPTRPVKSVDSSAVVGLVIKPMGESGLMAA
jgi:hypothetical protein